MNSLWKFLIAACVVFVAYHWAFGLKKLNSNAPIQLEYIEKIYGSPSTKNLPMIFVFHGTGTNEKDMLPIFQKLSLPLRVISFRGPINRGLGGYTWPKDPALYQSIAEAANELVHRYLTVGKPILFGFSAGGNVIYEVLSHQPDLYDAAFIISGPPGGAFNSPTFSSSESTLPLFIYHGTQDQVVPLINVKGFLKTLEGTHFKVQWYEFEGGHGFTPELYEKIKTDLAGLINQN